MILEVVIAKIRDREGSSYYIVCDEQGVNMENYDGFRLIKKVHPQIELSIIKKSDGYVDLTSPWSNMDACTSSNSMDWKALHLTPFT